MQALAPAHTGGPLLGGLRIHLGYRDAAGKLGRAFEKLAKLHRPLRLFGEVSLLENRVAQCADNIRQLGRRQSDQLPNTYYAIQQVKVSTQTILHAALLNLDHNVLART
eukprot:scaffold16428_cov108-Isochrysis_galbana.AAC.2